MMQVFDYVHHSLLIDKLEAYGIGGNVLKLIVSYLANRKQITEINRFNTKSKREKTFHSTARETRH